MGKVRPLRVQAERYVLRWRTYRGAATAERFLDLLAVALEPRGWSLTRLYRAQGVTISLLWVSGSGRDNHIGVGITVLAVPGGAWGYHVAERGRHGYLAPCGDAKAAAEEVETLLKYRLYHGRQ